MKLTTELIIINLSICQRFILLDSMCFRKTSTFFGLSTPPPTNGKRTVREVNTTTMCCSSHVSVLCVNQKFYTDLAIYFVYVTNGRSGNNNYPNEHQFT